MNEIDFEYFCENRTQTPTLIGREGMITAAVIVPLILTDGEYHFVFEKRAAAIVQGGEICFPGGMFETGIDVSTQDTALRETCEELGITREALRVRFFLGSIAALRGIVVDCYVATMALPSVDYCKVDTKEVESVFTLPAAYFRKTVPQEYQIATEMKPYTIDSEGNKKVLFPARQLGLPQKYWHPWQGREHRVLLYPSVHGPVWGLTAEIVREITVQIEKLTK